MAKRRIQLRRLQAGSSFITILNREVLTVIYSVEIREYCDNAHADTAHTYTGYAMIARERKAEWIVCPLCSEKAAKRRHQEGDYCMVPHLKCGFVCQNPRP